MPEVTAHHLTWLAIIVCVSLVLPGMVVGYVPKVIYTFILHLAIGDSWTRIGSIIDSISLQFLPEFLQTVIAGGFAMGITAVIFRKMNFEVVFFATTAFYIGVVLFLFSFLTTMKGIPGSSDTVGLVVQVVGLAVGLRAMAMSRSKRATLHS